MEHLDESHETNDKLFFQLCMARCLRQDAGWIMMIDATHNDISLGNIIVEVRFKLWGSVKIIFFAIIGESCCYYCLFCGNGQVQSSYVQQQ